MEVADGMTTELMIAPAGSLDTVRPVVPALVADAGEAAAVRFFDFFTANLANDNTRRAYHRAAADFFAFCERGGVTYLRAIQTRHVAAWVEQLKSRYSPPTV